MDNRDIHMFDLDGTLWDISSMAWLVDKEKPHIPILKLTSQELHLIQNGMYKKDNLLIDYNDHQYWISKEIYDRINKKKTILDLNRLGVSFVEFYSDEYINNNKIKFLMSNIRHLTGTNALICILTGRPNRERHADLLNELRLQLKSLGLELFKIYFVSDYLHMRYEERISLNKLDILMEHLIGMKIENNKFVPLKQDTFNRVFFYDDEIRNIQYANDIQTFLERVMRNSDDEMFHLALNRIKNNEIKLINNLVTGNEINKFHTTEVIIKEPNRYPLYEKFVKKFHKYVNDK